MAVEPSGYNQYHAFQIGTWEWTALCVAILCVNTTGGPLQSTNVTSRACKLLIFVGIRHLFNYLTGYYVYIGTTLRYTCFTSKYDLMPSYSNRWGKPLPQQEYKSSPSWVTISAGCKANGWHHTSIESIPVMRWELHPDPHNEAEEHREKSLGTRATWPATSDEEKRSGGPFKAMSFIKLVKVFSYDVS